MKNFFAASALALFAALPASAFDISNMTAAERADFRAEIRDYLLANPEVLMEAFEVLEDRQEAAQAEAEVSMLDSHRDAIFNDGYSYVGGNPEGDITVVEFLDYRCGFCKRAFPAIEELVESDGNIRFVVKEFPILGAASVLGSRYAIATKMVVGDDAYKTVHDELMMMRGDLSDATLERLSADLDFDHAAIVAMMEDEKVTEIIQANRELGQILQINGTPTFIMGDQFVRGFIELDQMRAIVDDQRG